jgi:alkylation response protein AidB-like acyl-CoA dehydrogenase
VSKRLLSLAATYANDWVVYGAPLKEQMAVQRSLAEIRVLIESARWLIYHAAWVDDEGQPARVEAAHVRLATAEMLNKTVDLATMIFGGPGPSPQIDIRRFVRGMLPTDALGIAMDSARIIIAENVLAESKGS